MKKKRIQQLVRLLPGRTGVHMHGFWRPKTERLAQRLAAAECDPSFGYKYIQAFISQANPLPSSVTESFLKRAFNHYAGVNVTEDLIMVEVEALTLSANRFINDVLQSLLVCQDVTIPEIA